MGTIQKFILTKREFDKAARGYNVIYIPADRTNTRKIERVVENEEVTFIRANEPHMTVNRKVKGAILETIHDSKRYAVLLQPINE